MTSTDRKRRMAREKRKKVRPRRKRRYSNLIIALPIIVFAGILILTYGPFGGGEAPDFTLTDVQGRGKFTLSSHRGKVVLIEFFKTDCSHCLEYLSTLKTVRTLYSAEDLTMISISVSWAQEPKSLLSTYATKNGITWYIAPDTGTVTDDYNINSTPTTVIVGKNGNIGIKRSSGLSINVLRNEIDSLL